MSTLVEAKRTFYRDELIAGAYDRQRFGGASGAYVNDRELSMVDALLPPRMEFAADVATGTGRLLPLLAGRAKHVLALDASMAMLRQATRRTSSLTLMQADAFALPIHDACVNAVTCVRLLFHLDDVRPLLQELRRVTAPGGVLIADTITWSPRGKLPLGRERWGERIVSQSRPAFRGLAQQSGWRFGDERSGFLISPYMYRRLPLALALALERLERHLPERLLCRTFWRLEAAS
jgi:SAM-dependent methyltransferase